MSRVVFYLKCRPQDADVLSLAKQYRRVFVGYPAWKARGQWNRHRVSDAIFDLRSGDWTPTDMDEHCQKLGYRRQVSLNRRVAKQVEPGSYVLVPRPGAGLCYIGKISGHFELVDDPKWADEYLELRKAQGLPYEPEERYLGDVVQTWPVEELRPVPFPIIPRWIMYRLLSRNTIGIIEDFDQQSVLQVVESLYNGVYKDDLSPTRDIPEIRRRLVNWITPSSFEHLICDLLQLEHPDWHWFHIGGSGDGDADGLAIDTNGKVVAAFQCKLRGKDPYGIGESLRNKLVHEWGTAVNNIKVYVAMLVGPARDQADRNAPNVEYWDGNHIAHVLRKHAKKLPLGITLNID